MPQNVVDNRGKFLLTTGLLYPIDANAVSVMLKGMCDKITTEAFNIAVYDRKADFDNPMGFTVAMIRKRGKVFEVEVRKREGFPQPSEQDFKVFDAWADLVRRGQQAANPRDIKQAIYMASPGYENKLKARAGKPFGLTLEQADTAVHSANRFLYLTPTVTFRF